MNILKKAVLLVPLDPVHDIGIKMINRALTERGHRTVLFPPDRSPEEVVQAIERNNPDCVLVSRTLGYGTAELLSRLIDLMEAAGLRKNIRIAVGGMAIRPSLAAELGFDAGYGPTTTMDEVAAFVENRPYQPPTQTNVKSKRDMTLKHSYSFSAPSIQEKLQLIAEQALAWAAKRTSPAIERALCRHEHWQLPRAPLHGSGSQSDGWDTIGKQQYLSLCDGAAKEYWSSGTLHPKTRRLATQELSGLHRLLQKSVENRQSPGLQHHPNQPQVFAQYGTGCPVMDITHIQVAESWGADGVVHFDPSWGARTEGFLGGYLSHQEDGTVITAENLSLIKNALMPGTLWQVRAHRGLNTPETVVLAGKLGADLTKINIAYGSLGGGTDPERLTVDGIAAMQWAAKYGLPFDVVTNEELCGVPAHKAFAGMLIVAAIGLQLNARPILQPLFCYSPQVMVEGQMSDNYIDFNAAKIIALRSIIDAPIWPGAPIGFLTQIEDRVQSSVSTSLHAMLAASLGVNAISIASSDEAYSGGPITVPARTDTLRGVQEAFRFLGHGQIAPTAQAREWAAELVEKIDQVLEQVISQGGFVPALYNGILGSEADGAYPGRAGRHTVREIAGV